MKIKLHKKVMYSIWTKSVAMPKIQHMKNAVKETISYVCGDEFKDINFEISMLFTDSDTIAQYNREYRYKDTSTDVLSFPATDFNQKTWREVFINTADQSNVYMGDIMFSYNEVNEAAQEMNWRTSDRLIHLLVHSTLHLLGFDHMEENERISMEGLEIAICEKLGLENPYQSIMYNHD